MLELDQYYLKIIVMTLGASYLKQITDTILKNNSFGIMEIKKIEILKCLNFNKEEYSFIVDLIKSKKVEDITKFPDSKPKTFEDLTIIRFYDQNSKEHIVTIYDTDELWQDAEILEIFPQ
jgi:hypothetical protein